MKQAADYVEGKLPICTVIGFPNGYSTTKVHFVPLTEQVISAYVATGEPRDKAGAYGMQGQGGLFVDRIEGDYTTVAGMSLPLLRMMILKLEEKRDPMQHDKN